MLSQGSVGARGYPCELETANRQFVKVEINEAAG